MPTYTLLIRNAKVVDGTGNPWFYGDIALKGDKIARIAAAGAINKRAASEVVDAAGRVAAPGFIGILSLSIVPLMVDGRDLSKITQGVTTETAWSMPATWTAIGCSIGHPAGKRRFKAGSISGSGWRRVSKRAYRLILAPFWVVAPCARWQWA